MKCFYHKADFDGICSAALVNLFESDCNFFPVNYGDNIDFDSIDQGEKIYIVDFSFPMGQMIELNNRANVIWIDHHKTALAEAEAAGYKANCGQMTRIGSAGCELTWEWFHGTEISPPAVVNFLGRYDVWDWHNLPGALEFQYGLRNVEDAMPLNKDLWIRLIKDAQYVASIISDGVNLLKYERRNNLMYVRSCGFIVKFEDLNFLAINKGLCNSLVFQGAYNPKEHDAMMAFVWRNNEWHVSLYSDKPEIDVSAIAKKFGGGGHHGAAGFALKTLPFLA